MKIGLVVPGFSASESDWCIPALWDLVRSLARDHEMDLHVFPLRYPSLRQCYTVHGATVHPQSGAMARGHSRLLLMQRSVRAVLQEHRRAPFDLLHAYWADEPGLVVVAASRVLRIPVIVSLAGGELADIPDISYGGQRNRANRLMSRIALRQADRVTAGSQYLMDIARSHVPRDRLVNAPFGVDAQRFTAAPVGAMNSECRELWDADWINVLHVASLVPVKDQTTLMRATATAMSRVPSLHLHLVGNGPMLPALRAQASKSGIGRQVHFHGDVAHDQLPEIYRSADFCVQSSRYEAQGMVVLEAAASGRATAGTGVGILPEFSTDVVAAGDVHGLAGLIVELARNSDLRQARSIVAQHMVQQQFTLVISVGELVDLYRRVTVH